MRFEDNKINDKFKKLTNEKMIFHFSKKIMYPCGLEKLPVDARAVFLGLKKQKYFHLGRGGG